MPDNCKFSSGDVAKVDDDARLQAGGKDCTFEKGAVILLSYDAPEDPALDPKKEVPVNPVMANPTPVPVHHEAPASVPVVPVPSSEETPAPAQRTEAPAPAVETQAHTEVPTAPSADDLGKLAESAGGNPMLALGLAALAVLGGGGAMWKSIQKRGEAKAELDQKRAEQEHELKLKELEIKAQGSGQDYSATQPPPCQAASLKQEQAIASLRSELEEIKGKLSKVERKSLSISSDFDGDDLVARLEKLEKAAKAAKRAPKSA